MNREDSLLALGLSLLYMVPGLLLGGWAIMLLWGWFLVPLGVVSIGLFHAVGISLLVNLFVSHPPHDSGGDAIAAMLTAVFTHISRVMLSIGIGWIVLQLMG